MHSFCSCDQIFNPFFSARDLISDTQIFQFFTEAEGTEAPGKIGLRRIANELKKIKSVCESLEAGQRVGIVQNCAHLWRLDFFNLPNCKLEDDMTAKGVVSEKKPKTLSIFHQKQNIMNRK